MSQGKEIELPGGPQEPLSPAAIAYQRAMEARKQKPEVGGGPNLPMPRLDMEPDPRGRTMAEQGAPARGPSIIEGGPRPAPMPSGFSVPGLNANDILPPEAKQDPEYMPGMGADVAVNQPRLALKYGVIRKGQRIPPQMLTAAPAGGDKRVGVLRESTVQGLEELAKLQNKVDKVVSGEEKAEQDAKEGLGGQAAKLAPEEDPKTKERARIIDDFDFDTFRQLITKDVLNNTEQKELIESRLDPLDLTDLIVNGFITQIVPIRPGQFEPEFQSVTGEDQIAIKRLIALEAKKLDAPDAYLLDKHSIMSIVVGVRSINKRLLPDHRDEQGNFDDERFWKKFNLVQKYPMHMLASLGLNFFWFDARVRKLFMAEKVKNG